MLKCKNRVWGSFYTRILRRNPPKTVQVILKPPAVVFRGLVAEAQGSGACCVRDLEFNPDAANPNSAGYAHLEPRP